MAKTRDYLVSFSPAQRTAHGFTANLSLLGGGENHTVTADSFPSLESRVRELARQFGQTCAPYIRLKDRKERKPAGFDDFCDRLRLIDVAAPAAPVVAGV
jgi:hypothetical protein